MHASIACLFHEGYYYVWVSLGNAMKAKQSKGAMKLEAVQRYQCLRVHGAFWGTCTCLQACVHTAGTHLFPQVLMPHSGKQQRPHTQQTPMVPISKPRARPMLAQPTTPTT